MQVAEVGETWFCRRAGRQTGAARRQTGAGAWGTAVEAKGKKRRFGQQFSRIWQERRRGVGHKRQAG